MSSAPEIKSSRKRQSMGPSPVVVQHTPVGTKSTRVSIGPGASLRRSNVTTSYTAPMLAPQGEASRLSKETVQSVKGIRGKEKKDMCDLNGRLASYMEKVKFLEATNKGLAEECEKLRKIKGLTGDRIKEEYEDELKEAREALAEASKELAPLQAKVMGLEDKVETVDAENDGLRKNIQDLQNQIEKLNQLLGEQEAETNSLRRTCDNLARDRDMAKKELANTRDDNARIRDDCEAARIRQINAENERDSCTEELDFVKETSEMEIQELRELLQNLKSIQPQIEDMWKSEFKQVIQDLQEHYNDQLRTMTDEQQKRYDEKLINIQQGLRRDNTDSSVVKTENKHLKDQNRDLRDRLNDLERELEALRRQLDALNKLRERENEECDANKATLNDEIAALRAELEAVSEDLDDLQNSKMDLELEIACYKKLLDGEETKIQKALEEQSNMQSKGGADLAKVIAGGPSGGGQSTQSSTMSQSSGRVQVTRTSKCAIQIKEVDQAGRHVCLSNTSTSKDFDLSRWTLTRAYPKGKTSVFKFGNCVLKAGKELKVFSYNNQEEMEDEKKDNPSLFALLGTQGECKSWGHGNGQVTLCDENGKEKASSKITYISD
ncbi:70 kDa neurofilament protein-like isoform X2 [Mercenaria mercenaria]|uniref:70 kDa neurofilament protein-like isoform X2 n=1 Tax=Mercenaria mercenaria TaxID=6596 RepID=UPI00234F33BD|nr:70 kDa neurofilament protein-like isoform X2 [Mercenaria mercenaria]